MGKTAEQSSIRVNVSSDKKRADIIIPPDFDRNILCPDYCEEILRQAGVEITDKIRKRIKNMVAKTKQTESEHPIKVTIAKATPAKNGQDGRVEWKVDEEVPEEQKEEDQLSFYDQSAFIMVETGQILGIIHPPTAGEDGRDVLGCTIAAKDGKEAKLRLDESILIDASGNLIAQQEGVLKRSIDSAAVQKCIEIKEYVDFSTGNIDFDGDVIVGEGVRDCFIVKATGDVEVRGLIEAATVETGGNLRAAGGFAGRERGIVQIGGSLFGRYLDNVHGEIQHDLVVDREIINCELLIHGNIESEHGSLIGGKMTVTGHVIISTIGSGAGVPTELIIGTVPRLEPLAVDLSKLIEHSTSRRNVLMEDQQTLNKLAEAGRMTGPDKERQTEIMFEMEELNSILAKAEPTYQNLVDKINQQRTIDVYVHRKLFSGTMFTLGDQRFKMNNELRGPVRIVKKLGTLYYERSGADPIMLSDVADIQPVWNKDD